MKLMGIVYSLYGKFRIKSSSWVTWKGLCVLCDIIQKFTKWNELNYFGEKQQGFVSWSCSSPFFSFLLSEAPPMHRLQDKNTSWDHQASRGAQAMGFP